MTSPPTSPPLLCCFGVIMSMRILFESYFWNVAIASVPLLVPILAIYMIFRLGHDLLWK